VAQKTIVHRGYHGTIEVTTSDYSLFGKILFLDEDIAYHGKSFTELETNFRRAVDEHIRQCRDKGQEPPFSE
jgi:predicted HicB family RNase H-like nuclease